MKNLRTSLFVVLLALCFTPSFTQIKLEGDTKMGYEWPGNDYNSEVSVEVFGLNTTSYRPKGRIAIGDYGSVVNGGNNISISEAWGWDSDQLQVHGKNGILFTMGGGNDLVGAELHTNGNFHIAGVYFSQGSQFYSDIRLKSNVKNLNGALASVLKLQGISYDFKSTKEDEVIASLNTMVGKSDKDIKDLEKFKKIYEDKKSENLNHIGFSAQDLQKVFPQLVKADDKGILAVNYVAIIPVVVEALKEQQKIIDDQAKTIEAQQKDIIAIKRKLGMQ